MTPFRILKRDRETKTVGSRSREMVMTIGKYFLFALPVGGVVVVSLLGAIVEADAQARPSWCSSQPKLNAAEGSICASPALWDLDARLSRAYRDTLGSAGPRRTELMRSQQGWLQARNACGAGAPCLEAIYQDRLTALSGFSGEAAAPVPPPQVSAGNAPPAVDTAPQIQRTADGRSLLSFPVTPPAENDFSDYVATFDFGQTKGLGSDDKPLANEDRSLIAITNFPATKTSYVHLFVRQPNGDLTVINSFNAQVAKMLKGRWAEAAAYRVAANAISGRIMQLSVFDYVGPGNNSEELKLKVSVAKDGKLTMAP
jgi:uncharacterized protein